VVVLSRDAAIPVRQLVTVAPVTTKVRGLPVEIPLGADEGLPRSCVANCDVISTIGKNLLRHRVGVLDREKIAALDEAVRFALGLQSYD
jgi:mRNA interferase MazF